MSSEEVAELAQAIHSHADALYESWTKGPEAIRRMTRMEDTLELLADPGLTPKLEHLVSTFVRRDKAKRQHGSTNNNSNNTNGNLKSNQQQQINNSGGTAAAPTEIEANHNINNNSNNNSVVIGNVGNSPQIVTNIPITLQDHHHQQQQQNVYNGGGGGATISAVNNSNSLNKKPLPKSILAVVQRFETPSVPGASSTKAPIPVPVITNLPILESSTVPTLVHNSGISGSISDRSPGGFPDRSPGSFPDRSPGGFPDRSIGSFPDRSIGSFPDRSIGSIPDRSPGSFPDRSIGSFPDRSPDRGLPGSIPDRSPGGIIERTPGGMGLSDPLRIPGIGNVSRNVLWAESSGRHLVTEKSLRHQVHQSPEVSRSRSPTLSPGRKVIRERHIPIERIDDDDDDLPNQPISSSSSTRVINVNQVETREGNLLVNNNLNHHDLHHRQRALNLKADLDHEEERLFQALRTGHLIPRNFQALRERALGSSPLSSSSRIAFAKERIRQSQEHPLTQQRLELQKRLPSPSSSLAAAIAVQQGKIKFQHNSNSAENPEDQPMPSITVRENGVGRHSWVSSLRFNNGASVADRVQLFEKYPSHVIGSPPAALLPHSSSSSSSSTSSSSGFLSSSSSHPHLLHLHHPGILPSSLVASSVSNSGNIISPDDIVVDDNDRNVSLLNVAMAPTELHGAAVSSAAGSSGRKANSPAGAAAPWRAIPIEPYQPDILSSGGKKSKSSSPSKPGSPLSIIPPLLNNNNSNSRSVFPPVPRFYYPEGKRPPSEFLQDALSKARDALAKFPPYLSYLHFTQILPILGLPLYWKKPIWNFLGLKSEELADSERFMQFYQRLLSDCPDEETRFLCIMSTVARKKFLSSPAPPTHHNSNNKRASISNNNNNAEDFSFSDVHRMHICMSDFIPMMQDIIDTHPGLGFLRDAPEFHSRYITTVISRIFYKVNRSWSGKLSLQELRRSNLMRIIKRLEEETDVNTITEYFSYEHFYVIYCKFWELDKDHDLLIDKKDLMAHAELALSSRIIDRIFDGTVIRGWDVASPVKFTPGKMTYSDFVWFLLSEEDKKTQTSIEYWFRCLDIDGDGVLSPYELQYFYQEQCNRLESLGIEPMDFANVYCLTVDSLRCSPSGIRLSDLKRNPQMAGNLFNTLFNLDKYLDHEQRDPFATSAASGNGGAEPLEGESDWDKYAAAEYEALIAEEAPSDNMHENSDFEDSLNTGIYPSP